MQAVAAEDMAVLVGVAVVVMEAKQVKVLQD
jgi:hypothetical protein